MSNACSNNEELLTIWTIYDHPSDFPNESFVARRFILMQDGSRPTDDIRTGTLKELRKHFDNMGMVRLNRFENDDPKIVEVWL